MFFLFCCQNIFIHIYFTNLTPKSCVFGNVLFYCHIKFSKFIVFLNIFLGIIKILMFQTNIFLKETIKKREKIVPRIFVTKCMKSENVNLRRLDRQSECVKKDSETDDLFLFFNKAQSILNEIQTTEIITLQKLTEIYSIISEIDVDSLSSFFPFRSFFNILEKAYPETPEIIHFLLLLISHSSIGDFFNPDIFICETDISFLMNILKEKQYKSCTLTLIASICYKCRNYIQLFCEKGLLDELVNDDLDIQKSNFLAFLSESSLSEFQSKSLSVFIKPLILFDDIQLILNGLIILDNLIKSSYEFLSKMLIEQYHCILVDKFKQFINLNSEELFISFLSIFCSIPNLSKEMISLLFYLIGNNNFKSMNSCLYYGSLIFREQYHFWKSEVDVDSLFKLLLPYVNSTYDISFKSESSVFLTLMRYGGYKQISDPIMIKSILKFVHHPNFSKMCLNALDKLLTFSKSPELLFGDYLEELFSILNELVNNDNEDISKISSILLERAFPDYAS